MSSETDWKLLAKYVSGEGSAEERARVEAWVREEPHRKARVERLRQVWKITDVPASRWDDDAAWKQLRQRMEEAAKASPGPSGSFSRRDRSARHVPPARRCARRFRAYRSGLAVAVTVAALLAVLIVGRPWLEGEASDGHVFTTAKGQRAVIQLTDGTQVHLNAESRLVLAAGFTTGRREVRLEGEAYFEVARDTTRPFLVHTETATVRVLGTAFNVNAYGDAVQVAVAEGEVALKASRQGVQDTAVVLRRQQVGVISSEGLQAVRRKGGISRYLAWTEGRLVFEDTPFSKVVQRLERWYDLNIEVAVPFGAVVALNASFDDEPLRVVLSDIALALDLQYQKEGPTVTFYRRTSARSASVQRAYPAR